MVTTQHKKILIKGLKGDTGDNGTDTTVPQAGIIAYKGDTVPDGYILYSEVPDGVLTHITATYTQTATITDASSLDELRPDLVVKAYYYDAETGITSDYVITDYTLSGTLTVGTSTITASYKGFSDSFDVTVEESITYLYNWDFTQSLTDKVQGLTAELFNGATQDSNGVLFNAINEQMCCGEIGTPIGKTIEVDVANFDWQGGNSECAFLLNTASKSYAYIQDTGALFFKANGGGWAPWGWKTSESVSPQTGKGWGSVYNASTGIDAISGKTVKIIYVDDSTQEFYIDDNLIGRSTGAYLNNYDGNHTTTSLWFGGYNKNTTKCYNMTIKGVRIYANQ